MTSMIESFATTNNVTSLTYIDLTLFNYDDFLLELTSTHAKLQHLATGNQGDRYLEFPGLMWWYTVTQKPEDRDSPNSVWHLLNGPGAYKTMLDRLACAEHAADVTLELTNNLEYATSDGPLPTFTFPRITIEDNYKAQNREVNTYSSDEVEAREVLIYPAYFTLNRAPQVTLPPSPTAPIAPTPNRRLLDHSPFDKERLSNFDKDFPAGLCLAPMASKMPLTQSSLGNPIACSSSNPKLTQKAPTFGELSPTHQAADPCLDPLRSLSPYEFHPSSSTPFAPSPSSPPSENFNLEPQRSHLSAQKVLPDDLACPRQSHPHNSTRSITIYNRPKSSLGRRYFVPFDPKNTTHGAPLSPSQIRHVSASDPTSYHPKDLGFGYMSSEMICFSDADWMVPDFGIFGGFGDGTVV